MPHCLLSVDIICHTTARINHIFNSKSFHDVDSSATSLAFSMASKALSDVSDLSYADIDQFTEVGEDDTAEIRRNDPTMDAIVPEGNAPPPKLQEEQRSTDLVVFPDYIPPHDTYYFNVDMIHLVVSPIARLHPSTLTTLF